MTNPHSHPILLDPIPDQSNRLAYLLGRVFHPAVICIPTLALVLRDLNLEEAVFWLLLVAGMVIVPGLIAIALLKQRGRFVYQRRTRGPVYIVIWFSIAASFIAILLLDGPEVLHAVAHSLRPASGSASPAPSRRRSPRVRSAPARPASDRP